MNTETQTVDLSTLTADQLQAELKRRQLAENEKALKAKKVYESDNEDFIINAVSKAKQLRRELDEFKKITIKQANDLYIRMYHLEGKEPKEVKTFSRINKAGDMKVTVDMQERFAFTDEAEVHIDAIQDIFKNKFQDRNKGFYRVWEKTMMRNGKGEFDPKLLAKARTEVRELGDDELISRFDKLDECQTVIGSSLYCRIYARDDKNKWQDISLNFSSL
ncbi:MULTISPECIES: DUF3164 family protein [Bizionia]|uniref:DUF3164 family protein n=1 Tax=Bizionia algoritergicola TaxID=291187 RepID=A0A5D0QKX7_9FLAO|nr:MULTISPECIES: DUF3164 family protein [Bizionia]OBX17747.1 hypothetical protein BAA08_15905 [Bizionia sp. APA-3]TYB69058.1 DUF3164 family protein [Bizionia algoritergicola]